MAWACKLQYINDLLALASNPRIGYLMELFMAMTAQAVGAYGEKIVEAELLRRGWLPGNVNHSVANAARFDIVAVKGERIVPIRVKTCAAKYSAFQFSARSTEPLSIFELRSAGDFIVLVAMGESRPSDTVFVAPSKRIQDDVLAWRKHYLEAPRKDGG